MDVNQSQIIAKQPNLRILHHTLTNSLSPTNIDK